MNLKRLRAAQMHLFSVRNSIPTNSSCPVTKRSCPHGVYLGSKTVTNLPGKENGPNICIPRVISFENCVKQITLKKNNFEDELKQFAYFNLYSFYLIFYRHCNFLFQKLRLSYVFCALNSTTQSIYWMVQKIL